MTQDFPQHDWHARLQSAFKLPLEDLVERFAIQHDLADGEGEDGFASFVDRPAGQVFLDGDIQLFIPERYEPAYAYPLIVWLCESPRDRRRLLDLMPRVSTRNYLAVAVSTDRIAATADACRETSDEASTAQLVFDTVAELRHEYNVHTERVYLAGLHNSTAAALKLMLERPEWFAGVVAYGGGFPQSRGAMARFRDLNDKRLLLAHGSRAASFSLLEFVRTGRLLHSAGVKVLPRIYDAADRPPQQFLADINEWLMAGIFESNAV